jgi:TatD DNase family protein
MSFLNLHSHQLDFFSEQKLIYNLLIQDLSKFNHINEWLTVGIHPWYADAANWPQQLQQITLVSQHPQVIGIGECGLDKLITMPITQQLAIFEAQVQLAENIQKPVIIHCVRAFNELIYWKKRNKVTVPLIIHGFNNNMAIAQQLLAHGFYISLGAALLKKDSNAAKTLRMMPLERFFLENDDSPTPIQEIYQKASILLDLPIDMLKLQIWRNFGAVFNISFND